MDWRAIAVGALLILSPFVASAQDRGSQDNLKRCIPKILVGKNVKTKSSPEVHLRPGEKFVGMPIVVFEVSANGDVSNASIKRSSGVQDIDRYALMWVRSLKYSRRPSTCPVADMKAGVTIDFAAD